MGPLLGLVAYIWGNGRGLSQRRGGAGQGQECIFPHPHSNVAFPSREALEVLSSPVT